MIKVVFWDNKHETYVSYDDVCQVGRAVMKINGRWCNCWLITFLQQPAKSLKACDYNLYRVELS